jgi:hypothetical protein
MGVNMFSARFWQWLTGRSASKAVPPTVPYVPPGPAGSPGWSGGGLPVQPLERNIEVHTIAGLQNKLSQIECRSRSAAGELIRYYEGCGDIVGGCRHRMRVASCEGGAGKDPRGREIAGLCDYCLREYQLLVEKGQMDPLEAERLSLICTDCAQMSTSGHLCCPRHRKAMADPDGKTVYLDPDAAKSMARQKTIAKALDVVTWLFAEPQDAQEHKPTDQE